MRLAFYILMAVVGMMVGTAAAQPALPPAPIGRAAPPVTTLEMPAAAPWEDAALVVPNTVTFVLDFTATATNYVPRTLIETSTNLVDWQVLTSLDISLTRAYVTVPKDAPMRFIRAVTAYMLVTPAPAITP